MRWPRGSRRAPSTLAQLLATEVGKILPHARFEAATVPFNLRFNAALALTDYGRAAEVGEDSLSIVIRQPVGVAGIFAPWNAPIALSIRSLAPALAAGCTATVILPEQTAQLNALISEVISETDELPPGVVNIVTGGREGITHLVESPDVPVISFTGSTQIGRAISAAGAPRLKRFGLELGGKAPMVIFDDADLDAAVAKVAAGLTVFAGQFCMTGSRAIVQRGIADRFRTALAERLAKVKVGPASDPASEMGPLIDRAECRAREQDGRGRHRRRRENHRARRPGDRTALWRKAPSTGRHSSRWRTPVCRSCSRKSSGRC